MVPKTNTSTNTPTYYLVPPLKSLVTHKLIAWIYEDNLSVPLSSLPQDLLEYMTSKMPFCVIFRVYEMKLAKSVVNMDFVKNYAETKQFTDETRDILVKQLKIKQETKIGLWTAFRRTCMRDPHNTERFWCEFTKKEREVARREIARREDAKEKGGDKKGKKDRKEEWGSKKGRSAGSSRTMMFREYHDLVVKTAEKYSIDNIPLFLLNSVDEDGLTEKVLRDLETEIKSFILKMKVLTNDFLPLQRQCSAYAPLPIWIKPSPNNKDHKYLRSSRTMLILQQRSSPTPSSSLPPSSSSSPSSSTSPTSSPSSSSSASPSSSSSASPSPSTSSPSTAPATSPSPSSPSSSSSSSSSSPPLSSSSPPSSSSSGSSPLSTLPPAPSPSLPPSLSSSLSSSSEIRLFNSVYTNLAVSSSLVQTTREVVQRTGAIEEHARNAALALRELRSGDARNFAKAVDERETDEESDSTRTAALRTAIEEQARNALRELRSGEARNFAKVADEREIDEESEAERDLYITNFNTRADKAG